MIKRYLSRLSHKSLEKQLSSQLGGNVVIGKSKNRLRNVFLAFGASFLAVSGVVSYKLCYLQQPVIIPTWVTISEKNSNNITNWVSNYRDLVILKDRINNTHSRKIHLEFLEKLINFQLTHDLMKHKYIRTTFRVPFLLQEFAFDKNEFTFEVRYSKEAQNDWLSRLQRPQTFIFNVFEVQPPEKSVDITGVKIKRRKLVQTVDLSSFLDFRLLETVGKDGVESLYGSVKNEFTGLVITGNVELSSGYSGAVYNVGFMAEWDESHRYNVDIISCEVRGDQGEVQLW